MCHAGFGKQSCMAGADKWRVLQLWKLKLWMGRGSQSEPQEGRNTGPRTETH